MLSTARGTPYKDWSCVADPAAFNSQVVRASRAFFEAGGFGAQLAGVTAEVSRALADCPDIGERHVLNAGCGEGAYDGSVVGASDGAAVGNAVGYAVGIMVGGESGHAASVMTPVIEARFAYSAVR